VDLRRRELLIGAVTVLVIIAIDVAVNKQPEELKAIIGLIGLVASVLILFFFWLHETVDRSRARVESAQQDLMHRILPMAESLSTIPPEVSQDIGKIVDAAAEAEARPHHRILNRCLVEALHAAQEQITEISLQGRFRCDDRGQETRFIREALESAEKSVTAISCLGDNWWRSASWTNYFGWYELHKRTHPEIEHSRIFLVTPSELAEPDVITILEAQKEAGIRTTALDVARIDAPLRQGMVLFDDVLVLDDFRRSDGEALVVSFDDSKSRIRAAIEQHEELLGLSNHPSVLLWQ